MSIPVRLQDLRDFTVQIRGADHKAIYGTGVAVSLDGQVVTLARVKACFPQHDDEVLLQDSPPPIAFALSGG